jgi:hypothetical protein
MSGTATLDAEPCRRTGRSVNSVFRGQHNEEGNHNLWSYRSIFFIWKELYILMVVTKYRE